MNWRMVIGIGLLLAALASGWSAWRQRGTHAPSGASQVRTDYVLGDFEIVTLDKDGKEAATLRAPSMERNAADQTSTIVRPLFLLPDAEGRHWQLRADTGQPRRALHLEVQAGAGGLQAVRERVA